MAIYTPRGLKIRIAVPTAFGLMARLEPKVSPFRVLKTTEGIESLPGLFALIAGLTAFWLRLQPAYVALVVASARLVGVFMNVSGFYVIPKLVGLATAYSCITGYGVILAVVMVTGFLLAGWHCVLAFFAGEIVAVAVSYIVELWQTRRYHKLAGYAITGSEVSFFNAYRLHAALIGVTTDIDLNEIELQQAHWGATFERFARDWPEVVRRFTLD